MGKLVVLRFERGNFQEGFNLTLRIGEDGERPLVESTGTLPGAPNLPQLYERWQSCYKLLESIRAITTKKGQSFNTADILKQWRQAADDFKTGMSNWLTAESKDVQTIRETLINALKDEHEEIRVLIQAEDPWLKKLPWQEWDLFADTYTHAEIALSEPEYTRVKPVPAPSRDKVRILAILGDSANIDTKRDKEEIQKLPGADPVFLEQPQREQLYRQLLDERGWDILFFAGHSQTESETGRIYINPTDNLTIDQLKKALNKAIKRGLRLAIFNSCDGLGVAAQLADWNMPQVIVMRELVPDPVAQKFLQYFLKDFAGGASLYSAVREARESLESFEIECPGVMWLPVICQNPAETPLTWQDFLERKPNILSRQELRQRKKLLENVKNKWVKGVLDRSLHGQIPIVLGLEDRPEAVPFPWDMAWETPDKRSKPLPSGTKVIDVFDGMGAGRTLLILGEPGSGKTITLLELARELISRAEEDVTQPVPVVLNLSTWANKKPTIANWLLGELTVTYEVPQQFAQTWIQSEKLLLLLDGLDEVSADVRESCLHALNQFCQEYGQTEMAVTSRIKDYEALSRQLRFQGALYIQPLTPEQIHQYLVNLGWGMEAVRTALQEDAQLRELATNPLMLCIMSLAYQGMSAQELPAANSVEERRNHLFSTYIERMFHRRQLLAQRYGKEESLHWLAWLAQRMSREDKTIFSIEELQPTWLPERLQKQMPLGVGFIFAPIGGLNLLAIILLIGSRIWGDFISLVAGLIIGGVYGPLFGIWAALTVGRAKRIEPVETLNLSWGRLIKLLAAGLTLGVVSWPIIRGLSLLVFRWHFWPLSELTALLIFGPIVVLLLELNGAKIKNKRFPNQGIWQSFKNAAILAVIVSAWLGIAAGLMSRQILEGIVGQSVVQAKIGAPWMQQWMQQFTLRATVSGMLFGLLFWLSQAGTACIQHFTLRAVLWRNGYLPWNVARFLDYATERIFLQKVGGSYIFIHRLLKEHFAGLTSEQQKG